MLPTHPFACTHLHYTAFPAPPRGQVWMGLASSEMALVTSASAPEGLRSYVDYLDYHDSAGMFTGTLPGPAPPRKSVNLTASVDPAAPVADAALQEFTLHLLTGKALRTWSRYDAILTQLPEAAQKLLSERAALLALVRFRTARKPPSPPPLQKQKQQGGRPQLPILAMAGRSSSVSDSGEPSWSGTGGGAPSVGCINPPHLLPSVSPSVDGAGDAAAPSPTGGYNEHASIVPAPYAASPLSAGQRRNEGPLSAAFSPPHQVLLFSKQLESDPLSPPPPRPPPRVPP